MYSTVVEYQLNVNFYGNILSTQENFNFEQQNIK